MAVGHTKQEGVTLMDISHYFFHVIDKTTNQLMEKIISRLIMKVIVATPLQSARPAHSYNMLGRLYF